MDNLNLLKSLNLIPSKKALKEQLVVLGLLIAALAITLPAQAEEVLPLKRLSPELLVSSESIFVKSKSGMKEWRIDTNCTLPLSKDSTDLIIYTPSRALRHDTLINFKLDNKSYSCRIETIANLA